VHGNSLDGVSSLEYTIEPKPGSASKPVDVTYDIAYLQRRGYAQAGSADALIPVFGLYAGYDNHVNVAITFKDGSSQALGTDITTPVYADPTNVYANPNVLVKRESGTVLGVDFFLMKNFYMGPVVIDTDGEIRWAMPGSMASYSVLFDGSAFSIGDPSSPTVDRLELDGTLTSTPLGSSDLTDFHHALALGKVGTLGMVDGHDSNGPSVENILIEFSPSGEILNQWNLGMILANYMRGQGDDPSSFVRAGVDWFHMNSVVYDKQDDSLLISSRENFVIKLDYQTGAIVWILGDPGKYWYSYPSLRAKTLSIDQGSLTPIGQHALSIVSDGLLMLFNDGEPNLNAPAGATSGPSRPYSAVSVYRIDELAKTAKEARDFDYGQSLFTPFCSSAYKGFGTSSLLVDYSGTATGMNRIVGLDPSQNIVFAFEYAGGCDASWNTTPVRFDALRFD